MEDVYVLRSPRFAPPGQLPMNYTNLIVYSEALDALELRRYCCRRMILTHVDLIEKLLKYVSTIASAYTGAVRYNTRPGTNGPQVQRERT